MLRLTVSSDLPTIADWIAQDPDHRGRVKPEFFTEGTCWVYSDAKGPILFARLDTAFQTDIILHVQFAPNQKLRTAKAIIEFDKIVRHHAITSCANRVNFQTWEVALIRFMEKLGWERDETNNGGWMRYKLPFRYRKLEAEDKELFESWLAKDAVHQEGGISWSDVVEPNTETFVVYDDSGPLQFVRFHRAIRIAIQYNPDKPYRNAKISIAERDWFTGLARNSGAREVIIRPGGASASLAEKVGFKEFAGKFIGV